MCKFCDDLSWREYRIMLRNFGADDNVCEIISQLHDCYDNSPIYEDGICYSGTVNCEDCNGCADENLYFSLRTYENNIGFDFYHKIRELTISPSSEMIQFNFCPWCGKQIVNNDNIVPFEKCQLGDKLENKED